MAKPIKETPTLYGKESDRFLEMVKKNESKKVSDKEYAESKKIYKKIMANAKI